MRAWHCRTIGLALAVLLIQAPTLAGPVPPNEVDLDAPPHAVGQPAVVGAQARPGGGGGAFINFETLPNGNPTVQGAFIGDSYAEWGVHFWSHAVSEQPDFWDGYNSDGMFAWAHQCTYPTGFNIVADFDVTVHTVSADVMTSAGNTVMMVAKDANGNTIDSVTSSPAPGSFWAGNLSLTTTTPIASVEWWPSWKQASVGVDNLDFSDGGWDPGDMNCDGVLDAFDIDPFVLALTDPFGYEQQYPDCDINLADINGDGTIDAFDIDPFVELLVGG